MYLPHFNPFTKKAGEFGFQSNGNMHIKEPRGHSGLGTRLIKQSTVAVL